MLEVSYLESFNPRPQSELLPRRTIAISLISIKISRTFSFNPRSPRRTIAIKEREKSRAKEVVSILDRPEGRSQYTTEAAWSIGAKVSILDRPEGRSQSETLVSAFLYANLVSILDRPEGRSQSGGGKWLFVPWQFQSSIAPKDDRNSTYCNLNLDKDFQ